MNRIYREILERRSDMTEWLIHCTRHNGRLTAREVLRQILVEGALRPGFSERSKGRTVYGPVPAVCFSEQPLAAFATYVAVRNDTSAIDGYGLLLHKHDVSTAGGRPVIYGLDQSYELDLLEKHVRKLDPAARILNEECLPLREQYRYVTFAPNDSQYAIDWSHEREWRWPADASHADGTGRYLLGMRYSSGAGNFRAQAHIIVRYDEDVNWLQKQINTAVKQNMLSNINLHDPEESYSEYWQKSLRKAKIISLETVKKQGIGRFEEVNLNSVPSLIDPA